MSLKLNANRRITGMLRGYDQFMNLVLEEAVEEVSASERNELGTVVTTLPVILNNHSHSLPLR